MAQTVLRWDFGDTLVDERWMRRAPDGCPDWERAWTEVMADHADAWNVGLVGSATIYDALAERTGMEREGVAAHARRCCRMLTFYPVAWRVAREHRGPQALVTVNPDLFSELVVTAHDLATVFDEIVTSHTAGTDDKVALCALALERLGFEGDRADALLIDYRRDLVEAWRAAGGSGYWFQGDSQFARDVDVLLRGR